MDDFTKALLKNIDAAEKLGCRIVKLRQTVEKYGGVNTAKEYLRKNRYSDGFEQLVDLKRMDLSMEALVVKGKYGALFTDDEVNSCFERLCADGFYVWKK